MSIENLNEYMDNIKIHKHLIGFKNQYLKINFISIYNKNFQNKTF